MPAACMTLLSIELFFAIRKFVFFKCGIGRRARWSDVRLYRPQHGTSKFSSRRRSEDRTTSCRLRSDEAHLYCRAIQSHIVWPMSSIYRLHAKHQWRSNGLCRLCNAQKPLAIRGALSTFKSNRDFSTLICWLGVNFMGSITEPQ